MLQRCLCQQFLFLGDSVQKAIEKYKNHTSVKAISDKYDKNTFSLTYVPLDEIKKDIKNLNTKKACQDTDIPTKIVQENSDIFAEFIFQNLNYGIEFSVFPADIKNADITPVHKKDSTLNPIIGLSAFYQIYQRYMKGASTIKYLISLTKNSPIINAVFVKDLVLSTVF